MVSMGEAKRRPATREEARALAHPLRLRILRLCLDRALTNKQLAERLGADPGTVLFHVRTLVRTGFLAAEPVRQGGHGAFEKPYRATGKSWTVDVGEETAGEPSAVMAALEAFRAELEEAGPESVRGMTRLALTLNQGSLKELRDRLGEVLEEFAARPTDPGGEPIGLFLGLHRRAESGGQGAGSGGVSPTS